MVRRDQILYERKSYLDILTGWIRGARKREESRMILRIFCLNYWKDRAAMNSLGEKISKLIHILDNHN